jgi:DNA-binding PadR family transcriptional regulator
LENRGYGYDLLQRLTARLGPNWDLHPASVYKALDRLEADGLVRATHRTPESETPGRGTRRGGLVVYEPTAQGVAEFRSWLRRPPDRREPIRSEFHLKLAVAQAGDVPALLEILDHEEWVTRRAWEECVTARPDESAGPAAAVVRTATAARVQGELSWIRAVRGALEDLVSSAEPVEA